jgi:hypothetical protein
MAFVARVLKVMIASPGDVTPERHMAREVIDEWNAVHATERRTILLPIGWDTNAAPATGDRPQAIINKQLLRDSDLLVAIFWTRLGTPTSVAASGTTEEIEEHVNAGRPAMLYFSSAPVRLDSVDEAQYGALREFKRSISERALVQEYESVADFRNKLVRQLAQTIIQHFPATETSVTALTTPATATTAPIPVLSPEARDLLLQAAKDANGYVLVTLSMDGLSVNTNGRNMVLDRQDPKIAARWRAAVKELVGAGLLEDRRHKGEVFQITDEGYRISNLLG